MKKILILLLFCSLSITTIGCQSKKIELENSQENIKIKDLNLEEELGFNNSKLHSYQSEEGKIYILELGDGLSEVEKDELFFNLSTGWYIEEENKSLIKSYVEQIADENVKKSYSQIQNNEKYIRIYNYDNKLEAIVKIIVNYIENKVGYKLYDSELDTIKQLVESDIIQSLDCEELDQIIESYKVDGNLKYVFAPYENFNYRTVPATIFTNEYLARENLKENKEGITNCEIISNNSSIQTYKINVEEGEVITLVSYKDTDSAPYSKEYYPNDLTSYGEAIIYDNNDLLENENTVKLTRVSHWSEIYNDPYKAIYQLPITSSGVLKLEIGTWRPSDYLSYSIWI